MIIVPTEKRLEWKNAPIVLIAIITLNLLVFILYQSGDEEKAMASAERFVQSEFVETEWPFYQRYLKQEDREDELEPLQQVYDEQDRHSVAIAMLLDQGYYRHIENKASFVFDPELYERWQDERPSIQKEFDTISSIAYGLKSNDVSVVTLISHQFLHGGFDHLFGNMVFLFLFGFAVEAAIGHLKFLLFYLLGGVVAGLSQVGVTLGTDALLVGASGAISATMAMYLAVFRLKKIEFFYWILFFVGYFRAPALLILPLYIGKEIYQYAAMDGSNVAYMAHAGGFVAGTILVGLAMMLNKKAVNEDYIEQSQGLSIRSESLAEIYRCIEGLRFEQAIKQVEDLIDTIGVDYQLARIRYNLEKIRRGERYAQSFSTLMMLKNLSATEMADLNTIWQEEPNPHQLLSTQQQLELAFRFSKLDDLTSAASIAEHLFQAGDKSNELLLLVQGLVARFKQRHDRSNATKFYQYSQQLTEDGLDGVM